MGLDIEKVAMLTSMVDKLIQMKRVDNALDESVVEDLIQKSLFISGVPYSDDEIAAVKRDVAYKYQIQAHPGESILADYEQTNWYDDRKAEIQQNFWTRYKNYLIDEKHFSPNVVSTLGNDTLDQKLMLLLGKEDRDVLFERAPHMMWRLIAANGDIKDYELFGIPFITVTDRVFSRIRNLTYRYMPNQQSLFPMETEQYDTWMLRELLNNCIAHSYYQSGERIYVNECEDSIVITNPGSFLPQTVEAVLQPTYNPPFYRNQLLADAMVKFHMIDTATSGIKKVYRIQKEKFFPLPDYNLSNVNQVAVTVYGKILDEKYTQLLYKNNESLDLETVFLLDKIQKHVQITKEQAVRLKKRELVEGRYPNIYVSFKVASMVGKKAEYVHNKGLDENICRQLILEALKNAPTTQHELLEVLDVGALPGHLSTEQKSRKLSNILQKMKKEGLVKPTGSRRYAVWSLV